MKIKVLKNGPYLVSGNVPLKEKIIKRNGKHYELVDGRELPQMGEQYALCRCGKSKNPPFCDATHRSVEWNGAETASREPYADRATVVAEGATMLLFDDERCAFGRFCHRETGMAWNLVDNQQTAEEREEALKAVNECPAGRLVATDKEGNVLEEKSLPEIIILQDPEKNVSAGIFVKGPIAIEAVDGFDYEKRNRQTLCRCGKSRNKPFCDGSHASMNYNDGSL